MAKFGVKAGTGSKITEPGYYSAILVSSDVVLGKPTAEEPMGTPMVALTLSVSYDGEDVEYVDKMYTTISLTSKLTGLLVSVGYGADYAQVLERSIEEEGVDLEPYMGQTVRSHFESRPGKDGRPYCTLSGYLPYRAPKTTKHNRVQDDDDMPF